MKKLKLVLFSIIVGFISFVIPTNLLVVGSISLSSCNEEVDTPVCVLDYPTLIILKPQKLVFNVFNGDTINFQFIANADEFSQKDIKKIDFIVSYENGKKWDTTWYPDNSEKKSFTKNYDLTISGDSVDKYLMILIRATNIHNHIAQKSVVLNIISRSGLNEYNSVKLGTEYNIDFGQFFNSEENKVYKIAEAKAVGQQYIDFAYAYNISTLSIIISPDNDSYFGIGTGKFKAYQVHTWTTRNATRFKIVSPMTQSEWEVLNNKNIEEKWKTIYSDQKEAKNLFDGLGGSPKAHVLFKTSKNKIGIFRVTSIDGYDDKGYITIDVKVQK